MGHWKALGAVDILCPDGRRTRTCQLACTSCSDSLLNGGVAKMQHGGLLKLIAVRDMWIQAYRTVALSGSEFRQPLEYSIGLKT
jgi:hypothetical protein